MNMQNNLPEITIKGVILGVLLATILAAANAYLGLFAGMTVSATIPAAVISMGVLRFFKRNNILENNIVQTCASAGEAIAAGCIFTLPALILLGTWEKFDYKWVTIIAGFGGVLGVLFTIPLRRSFIVDSKLQFPEGIATAKVLESGQSGGKGLRQITLAGLTGGLFKVVSDLIGLWPAELSVTRAIGRSVTAFGVTLSPALLAVGLIVGINIGTLMLIGGLGNWIVAIPIVSAQTDWPRYQLLNRDVPAEWNLSGASYGIVDPNDPKVWDKSIDQPNKWNIFALKTQIAKKSVTAEESAAAQQHNADIAARLGTPVPKEDYAQRIWSKLTRFIGVGGMLVGGLWTVFKMRRTLLKGVTSGLAAYRHVDGTGKAVDVPRTERDMPMKWILILMVLSVIPLFFVYQAFVLKVHISLTMAVLMLIAGFAFSAVAGYMAGLVGSSNNPISGVTITTIVFAAFFLMLLIGKGAPIGPAAAIIIGAVVCCAASIAGDNLQDLKTGYIVGATPWKQQVMLAVGTLTGAAVIAPVLTLLQQAYGFAGQATAGPRALPAPQANVMASVAKGVFQGGLPWTFIFIGMGVAVGLIILDSILERRKSPFRTPVLAVAIGFYLPLALSVPIFLGGLIQMLVTRHLARRQASHEERDGSEQKSVLFASGLITGEALMGIILAIPVVLMKNKGLDLPFTALWQQKAPDAFPMLYRAIESGGAWVGLAILLLIGLWAYTTGRLARK